MSNTTIYNSYNITILADYGYTLYSNGTLSNSTDCYLSFGPYQPIIFVNGTVSESVGCDFPYYSIKTRGAIGLAFAFLIFFNLILTIFNLRKHGAAYVAETKRFRLISRRWPWYWLIIFEILVIIVGFFSIDIDRDYIQGNSMEAYGAIFTTVLPASLAVGWEFVRHWSSSEERILVEHDQSVDNERPVRKVLHLFMSIICYFFILLTFFLTVLRSWSYLGEWNPSLKADTKWKVGGFAALLAFIQILNQVLVSALIYKTPWPPLVIILITGCVCIFLIFNLIFQWQTDLFPFSVHESIVYLTVMGYLPLFLIASLSNLWGLMKRNEDLIILDIRKEIEEYNHLQYEAWGSPSKTVPVIKTIAARNIDDLFDNKDHNWH